MSKDIDLHTQRSDNPKKATSTPIHHNKVIQQFMKEPLFTIEAEDYQVTALQFQRLKVAELVTATLALLGFGCASISYDLSYSEETREDKYLVIQAVLIVCSISTILLIASILWRTNIENSWRKSKGSLAKTDTIFNTGQYIYIMQEVILNLLHPNILIFDKEFSYEHRSEDYHVYYQYNSLLTLITVFRLYHLVRAFSILSIYRSERAQRICYMNGSNSDMYFAIKCSMQDSPEVVATVMFVSGIFIFGYCLRILERPLLGHSGQDFSDYGNSLWCIILIMTTVGYGDFYPVSVGGRLIGFLSSIWGVVIVSIIVVTVSNMLELETGEGNALLLLQRLGFKKQMRKSAAKVLSSSLKYKLSVRKNVDKEQQKHILGTLQKNINEFKHMRQQQRQLYNFDSPDDRMERKINLLLEESEDNKSRIEKVLERVKNLSA